MMKAEEDDWSLAVVMEDKKQLTESYEFVVEHSNKRRARGTKVSLCENLDNSAA